MHDVPAAPDAAAAPSKEAALAVNQALDAEPPTLCLQLDSATQPELLPLQDPTPMVSHPDTLCWHSSIQATHPSRAQVQQGLMLFPCPTLMLSHPDTLL